MEAALPRREDWIGLLVALALHVLLVLVLIVQPGGREPIERPDRMTVNLAEEIGMEATAPVPVAESRAAVAPEITNDINPTPVTETRPQPAQARNDTPVRDNGPRRRPDQQQRTPPQETERRGGSRVGDNFLTGAGGSTSTTETRIPASQIGASAKASLFQAVGRQLRPHWRPVDGADRELLVSKVRFRLNPDGTLSGAPRLVGQNGVTDANRTQAPRHAENAIRAVQLAAPFDLPDQYYEGWKLVTVDFDWKLAQ